MLPEIMQTAGGKDVDSQISMTPDKCIFPPISNTMILKHFSTGCNVYTSGHYDYVIKIILLGDLGVGKTSLMKAIAKHPELVKVPPKHQTSRSNDHIEVEVMTSSGQKVLARLCDTGGQERYRSLTSSYYRGAHGVMLMFNVCNQQSLDHIDVWLSDLDMFLPATNCARVLVASNCTSTSRSVPSFKSRSFAENHNLAYAELDSGHFYNVIETLKQTVELVIRDVTSVSNVSASVIRPGLAQKSESQTCYC